MKYGQTTRWPKEKRTKVQSTINKILSCQHDTTYIIKGIQYQVLKFILIRFPGITIYYSKTMRSEVKYLLNLQ